MKIELVIILILIMVLVARIEYKYREELNKLKRKIEFLELPEYRQDEFNIKYRDYDDYNNLVFYVYKEFNTDKDLGKKIRIGKDIYIRDNINELNVSEYTYRCNRPHDYYFKGDRK